MRLHLAAIVFMTAAPAAAGSMPPDCRPMIDKIIEHTGAAIDRISDEDRVFLKHPWSKSFVVDCESAPPNGIFISWGGAHPPKQYYALLGLAGSIKTGEDAPAIEKAARQCHDAALRDPTEMTTVTVASVQLDCHAFTRDGGSTDVSLTRIDP